MIGSRWMNTEVIIATHFYFVNANYSQLNFFVVQSLRRYCGVLPMPVRRFQPAMPGFFAHAASQVLVRSGKYAGAVEDG
jgi:hypothetical protein